MLGSKSLVMRLPYHTTLALILSIAVLMWLLQETEGFYYVSLIFSLTVIGVHGDDWITSDTHYVVDNPPPVEC